jgi:hypothetical protein
MSWAEADPLTAAALMAVGKFGVPVSHQLAALKAAIAALKATGDVEAQLEEKAEYAIAGDSMFKIRDRIKED